MVCTFHFSRFNHAVRHTFKELAQQEDIECTSEKCRQHQRIICVHESKVRVNYILGNQSDESRQHHGGQDDDEECLTPLELDFGKAVSDESIDEHIADDNKNRNHRSVHKVSEEWNDFKNCCIV